MLRGTWSEGRRLPAGREAWREGTAEPLARVPGRKAVSHLHINGLKPACSTRDDRNLPVYLNVFTVTASTSQDSLELLVLPRIPVHGTPTPGMGTMFSGQNLGA